MAARETTFKCLRCGHEYDGMFDPDHIQERSCPKCRSNSVRKLSGSNKTKKN